MENKWSVIVNVVVFVVVVLVLAGIVRKYSFEESSFLGEECIEVNKISSFTYDACYDAYSKKIFLKIKRGQDSYDISSLDVSFFDFYEQSYNLDDVPLVSGADSYIISSGKNPQNMEIVLNAENVRGVVCEEPRIIFVKYCPVVNNSKSGSGKVSPLNGEDIEDYIEVGDSLDGVADSDIFSTSLINSQRIWESRCKSRWECGEWSFCDAEGVQGRDCEDLQNCFVSTDAPLTVQYCDDQCSENWECEWSDCRGGFTVPKCRDLNKCGTKENLPFRIDCRGADECTPAVNCGEWSDCEISYSFLDLVGGSVNNLDGVKSRLCVDSNSCVKPSYELASCFLGVDVYTDKFVKCGREFVGIYNLLNNELIARIDDGTMDNPHLNIYFEDGEERLYCDYCFDGKMNGDEQAVDCGGSCESCASRYSSR